ncbi:hypothetical protein O7632_31800 [Solwaraspora sp. WMMD406]|uniref:hypothetical protein n=1 Tax=Solwaraspora sp. WMMD406 TaxID=3016095 RepID=UPI002417198D|nr:hypothetical protein [Solwaraspora sp. WMMD406]MDG4768638.1 hypothetical protein [Solwaraspora sp. WMMD406]
MAEQYLLISAATATPTHVLDILRPLLDAIPVEIGLANQRRRLTVHAWHVDHPDDLETANTHHIPDAHVMAVIRYSPTTSSCPPDDPHGDNMRRDIITAALTLIHTTTADAVLTADDTVVLRNRQPDGITLNTTWPGWTDIPTLTPISTQHPRVAERR